MTKDLFSRRHWLGVFLIGIFPPVFLFLSQWIVHGFQPDAQTLYDFLSAAFFSIIVTAFLFFGTNFIVHQLQQKLPWNKNAARRLLLELVLVISYVGVGMFILSLLFDWLFFNVSDVKRYLYQNELLAIIIALMVTMFMEGKGIFINWKAALVRTEQLKKEMAESQYEALKNQVNPHFLFNSLNALSSLVHKDPDKAVEFIQEFSKTYRYVLEVSNKVVVEVASEVDFLNSWFFLQKIRFGENLKVEMNIPAEKMHHLVPPISLQLLAENAIKHNEICTDMPLHICITEENDFLVIKNNLQLRDEDVNSMGIGLSNLKSRYEGISEKLPEFIVNGEYYIAKIPMLTAE